MANKRNADFLLIALKKSPTICNALDKKYII